MDFPMAKKVTECLHHYFHGLGYNCAETTLRAADEAWELHLPEEAFRLMGGFGGGMGVQGVAFISHYLYDFFWLCFFHF